MKKLISAKLAGNILLVSYGLLIIFHVLVLAQVVPSNIVWGGQIGGSQTNLRMLEGISLILTVLFAIVVAIKIGYIKTDKFKNTIRVLLWIIFAYSLLNIIGNLASGVTAENLIFAPISIAIAFLVLRLAIE